LGELLRRRTERASGKEPLLSVTQARGVISQKEVGRRDNSSDEKGNYWRVHIGDIVYNTMRMWQGVSGRSNLFGIVSPAYTVCEPSNETDSRFLSHLFKHPGSIAEFYRLSQGLVSDTWNLKYSSFAAIELGIPPKVEQQRIAEILDALDEQIHIESTLVNKLIALGEGLLAAQLNRLDPTETVPLTRVTDIRSGVTLGSASAGTVEVPYLRVANVQDGFIDTSEMKTIRVNKTDFKKYLLEPGDVLLTEGGDFDKLGRGAVWDGRISPCIYQNHLFRVRCDRSLILPDYLTAYTSSTAGKQYFLTIAKQTTNLATINSTQLKAMPVPVPSLETQQFLIAIMATHRERVETEQTVLSRLVRLKQGIMDDLMMGRVRVSGAETAPEST
jgi:type I restriction enzyme S subunit